VYSVPLLAERGLAAGFDVVVVVVADIDRRMERLMRDRGMTPEQVRARAAAQLSDEERARVADVLIDNDGGPRTSGTAGRATVDRPHEARRGGRMRYRAVFFDVGETLVHPAPSFPELFAQVVERQGHRVLPEEVVDASRAVNARFSQASRDGSLWTTSPERSRAFWSSVYVAMLGELGLPSQDGLRDALYVAFTDRSNYTLFDDVRPILEQLASEGYALGIVSNFEAWLDDLLADLGVRDAFGVRVISGIEGMEKPDPRIYRLALDRADIDAADAVYVGDNPEFDIVPTAALGMFPVFDRSPGTARRPRGRAHHGPR
jgi:putative hydrolase of the HAD superfamily